MKLSEARDQAVFKVKILLGDKLIPPREPGAAWVQLREPTYAEAIQMSAQSAEAGDVISGLLPSLIVGSNLEGDAGKDATPEEAAQLVCSTARMFLHVVKTWQEALPLPRKTEQS